MSELANRLFAIFGGILHVLPVAITIRCFRFSRILFAPRVNEILEEKLFSKLLKKNPGVLSLPRIKVPIPVERKMSLRIGDESQRAYWLGHSDSVAAFLIRNLRWDDTFIDIGANCGFMTLLASSVVRDKQIYCFEPNPRTFEDLRGNLRLNQLSVNAYNLGLSNEAGRCRLFVPEGASGGSSIEAKNYRRRDLLPGEKLPTSFHEIEVVAFDDFWNQTITMHAQTGRIIVKIDAEGHELTIIEGMKKFIRDHLDRLMLVVEVYESEYDRAQAELGAHGLCGNVVLPSGLLGPRERPDINRFENYCFRITSEVC